ncbi:MAG: PaaI family thioesterase [Motiliproteus sp.]
MLTHTEKYRLVEQALNYIPHVGLQGIQLERLEGEAMTLRLPYRQELVGNIDTGVIHSGVITMLLDTALGCAALCSDQVPPTMTPTLDLRIDHLAMPEAGKDIFATSRIYKATRRVLFIEGYAYCDNKEQPFARATGNFILMPQLNLMTERSFNTKEAKS